MLKDGNHQEFPECLLFPEAVRLLWEGTRKAVEEWGIDTDDLASLCRIIVRLADHRLMVIEVSGSPPGSEKIAEQVRHYRDLASDWLKMASSPPPEPDWAEIDKRLRSVGAAPLNVPMDPKS